MAFYLDMDVISNMVPTKCLPEFAIGSAKNDLESKAMAGSVEARITKRVVDDASIEADDFFIRDTDVRGFGLRVRQGGTKTYFVDFRLPGGRAAEKGRYTIGRHGSPWTPDSARKEAIAILEQVRRGINPNLARKAEQKEKTELALGAYCETFIEKYCRARQPRSWQKTRAIFHNDIVPTLGSQPITKLTRPQIVQLLSGIAEERAATARYAHAILRKMFKWAVDRGDLAQSPISDMSSPARQLHRDRVLSDVELSALWQATFTGVTDRPTIDGLFGSAIRLLILTGQRRDEVLSSAYADIDIEKRTWTIPGFRAKNGKPNFVPINEMALSEIEQIPTSILGRSALLFTTTGRTPISGISKLKARLDERMSNILEANGQPFEPWRLHDIRRTVATGLQRLGVRLEVTEAILNHVSGSRSGIVGVYQRYQYQTEKAQALADWNDWLTDNIISSKFMQ
jgi:integrase